MSTLGIKFTRKTLRPALGSKMGLRRSISIGFDEAEFRRISEMAQKAGIGFQEQVRRLCKAWVEVDVRKADDA